MFLWEVIWKVVQKVSLPFVDLRPNWIEQRRYELFLIGFFSPFLSIVPELNKLRRLLNIQEDAVLSFTYVLYATNRSTDLMILFTRNLLTIGGRVIKLIYISLIYVRKADLWAQIGMSKKVQFLPQFVFNDKCFFKRCPICSSFTSSTSDGLSKSSCTKYKFASNLRLQKIKCWIDYTLCTL